MLVLAVLWFAQGQATATVPAPHAKAPAPAFSQLAAKATAAREANQIEQATGSYRQALKLKPDWAEGWWYLGTLYYDADRYPEGRDAFRRLVALDAKASRAWALLGLCEFRTKEYDLSLAHLRQARALGMEPGSELASVAMYHMAILMPRFEHYEDGLQILVELARRGKDESEIIPAMGIAALRKPILPAEVPESERELVLLAGRAELLIAQRKSQQAREVLETLVARYPQTPNVHSLFGFYLIGSDPSKAISELREEIKLQPHGLPALLTLALEYLRQDKPDDGLPLAQEAVRIEASSFAAHNVLGRLLVAKGETEEGVKELEISRRIAPDSPQTRIALASAYAKLGRNDLAAKERAEFLRLRKLAEAAGEPKP